MRDKGVEIVLIGAGGHCRSVIDVIEQAGEYHIAGLVGLPEEKGGVIQGYEVFATDDDMDMLIREYSCFHISLGFLRSPEKRTGIYKRLKEAGAILPVIISPLAYVSRHASLGEGTIVMHQALVNAAATIGRNSIINSKALIEHDAVVGDHCHIATAAVINGGVMVGDGSFIGSNAVTKQGAVIPAFSFVKAGAIVK